MTAAGYMKAYSRRISGLASAKGIVDYAEPGPVGLSPHQVGGLAVHVDGAAIGPVPDGLHLVYTMAISSARTTVSDYTFMVGFKAIKPAMPPQMAAAPCSTCPGWGTKLALDPWDEVCLASRVKRD